MEELLKENETLKIENKKLQNEKDILLNERCYFYGMPEKILEKKVIDLKDDIEMLQNHHKQRISYYDNIHEHYNNYMTDRDNKMKEMSDNYFISKKQKDKIIEELQKENNKLKINEIKINKIINI